jgi:hypothetical protein
MPQHQLPDDWLTLALDSMPSGNAVATQMKACCRLVQDIAEQIQQRFPEGVEQVPETELLSIAADARRVREALAMMAHATRRRYGTLVGHAVNGEGVDAHPR